MSSNQEILLLLEAKEIKLSFQYHDYRLWTLRDLFIQVSKNPFKAFFGQKRKLEVLKGVNLQIYKGDRIGILGRNGAGKTSLCRCLAGLYKPSSGEIKRNGQVRAVFDTQVGINPELTGMENLFLLTKFMYPGIRSESRHIVEDAASFSELGDFLNMPFKSYSNGMKARLCLSLITAKPTDVLILDEVFDGADATFKQKISIRMQNMIQASGAVIFVSHSPDQMRQICNKALVLDNGVVSYFGDVNSALNFYNQSLSNIVQ